ncbi:MAG: site-2 protease family protein [Actinomycetota bacterium]
MFGSRTRWRLGSIGGVPIYVDPMWAIVVLFITASQYEQFKLVEPQSAFWLALLFAAPFFAAVFIHELAHAWVSRLLHIPVRGITMVFFGGATETRANSRGPGAEFLVSAAGPASTLVMSGVFWLIARALHGAAHDVVQELASLNLLFAIFNALPAVPLDGGRMLTAVVWRLTGDRRKAQRTAGYVGIVAGVGVGLLGYQQFTHGSSYGFGPFLLLVAFILIATGRSTEPRVRAQEQLAQGTAADAMRAPPAAVQASMSLQEALDAHLRDDPQGVFPVVEQGQVIGTISVGTARKVGRRDPSRPVRDGMAALDLTPVFRTDERLDGVAEWLNGLEGLVLQSGSLVGAIGPEDITRWYQRTILGGADVGVGAGAFPPRPDL